MSTDAQPPESDESSTSSDRGHPAPAVYDLAPRAGDTVLAGVDGLRVAARRIEGAARPADPPDRYRFGEIRETPLGARVIFGDVAGDPLCAPDLAAEVLAAFGAVAPELPALTEVSYRIALSLREDHLRGHRPLVRLLLAERPGGPAGDGSLTLVNRGYPNPLLVVGRRVLTLEPIYPTPPIGALTPGTFRPPELTVAAGRGERVLLYTDELAEAAGADGTRYPFAERAPSHLGGDFADALRRLAVDVEAHFAPTFPGDAALFLIEPEPLDT
ncbi:SpoIIE family protein phosphatase [Embleya hyalina]|uniref:SpoIIE family protein phosphatase n=1 Tax=Embleya hyalina TaxID=516124 RepID=UPI000F8458FA|nr:SpoIIE family protein phosphatase [Embleya hyalina]